MDASGLPPGFELNQPAAPSPQVAIPGALPEGFELDSEHYGSTGQQVGAALEGAARGVVGPIAPAVEKYLNIPEEDIRGRAKENPVASGIGEAAGLTAGMLTGSGEAALLSKAGEAAVGAAKLSEATSFGAKVGSEAVRQAAEMAVYQGGDEISKQILHDPDASAQSAIANIGLSGMLGGVVGGALGTVSPLWKATVGPKAEELLTTLKSRLDGQSGLTPKEGVDGAIKGLGLQLDPLEAAAVSEQGPMLGTAFERDNQKAIDAVEGVKDKVSQAVSNSLGIKPEEVLAYDKADSGELSRQMFENEFRKRLGPVEEQLNKQAAEDAHILVPDNQRLAQFGRMVEKGQKDFTPTSEYAKEYEKYGQALLDAENIHAVTKIESEVGNKLRGMLRGGSQVDYNTVNALKDIKSMLRDYREGQITKSIMDVAGPESRGLANEAIAEKLAVRAEYGKQARIIDEAIDHFGLGHFEGKETLASKIAKMSPEQAANKFSFKNNRDAIAFLQQHFPGTFEAVRQNEAKEFLKPAMLKGAKKGTAIDVAKLSDTIDKMKAGQSTYLHSVMGPQTLAAVDHAKTLLSAIPDFRSSKTAKWTEKLFAHLPASALAAVQFMAGHNPIGGLMVGEMAHRLGKDVPDAIKLGYLNWLGKSEPVRSEAFKASVDFIDHSIKGQTMIQKGVKNIFKPGAMVLSSRLMPSDTDRARLDKAVSANVKNPNEFVKHQGENELGHYMPQHQVAVTQSSAQAMQYLASIKPQPHKLGPLDKEVPPQPAEVARYNRALDIAQSPAVVLSHIKNGTLLPSDIKDLNSMYPALYRTMSDKLTNALVDAKEGQYAIPYKTRIGISLFLGQPIDSTMAPSSILAAQPQPPPVPAAQGGAQGKGRKGTSTLGKSNKNYMTSDQRAEEDRAGRD